MLRRLTSSLGPLPRFLLGMAGILALLALTAGVWFLLPPWPRATLTSQRGPCDHIHIAFTGQALVAVHEKKLAVWDLARRQELGTMAYQGPLQLLFSPDGLTLAIREDMRGEGTNEQSLRLWRPATQPAPVSLPGNHSLIAFYTPDSRFLFTFTEKTYKVWDVTTFREHPFPIRVKFMDEVRLLGDGRIMVSECHNQEGWLLNPQLTKIWSFNADLTLAASPIRLPGRSCALVSPDGRLYTAWHLYSCTRTRRSARRR